MTHTDKIHDEVMKINEAWVESFNNKDTGACVDAYAADAKLIASPYGTFNGIHQIGAFWRPFIESGAADLEYNRVHVSVEDGTTALLTAEWTMNLGEGVIIMRKWVKDEQGSWRIEIDHFETREQF